MAARGTRAAAPRPGGCTFVMMIASSSVEVTWVTTSPDLSFHSVIKKQSSRKTHVCTSVKERPQGAESLLGHEGGAGGHVSEMSCEAALRPA